MGKGHWVLVITCSIVAALSASLFLLQWEQANRLATSVSALAGLAAVGVAVWAALRPAARSSCVTVRDSGAARARGIGRANSGIRLQGGSNPRDLRVRGSGDATASNGGWAVSGIDRGGPRDEAPRS